MVVMVVEGAPEGMVEHLVLPTRDVNASGSLLMVKAGKTDTEMRKLLDWALEEELRYFTAWEHPERAALSQIRQGTAWSHVIQFQKAIAPTDGTGEGWRA